MAKRTQEQIDAVDAVVSEVRRTLRKHPSPPRPVDTVRLALATYRGKVFKMLAMLSVITTLFVITFYQPGGPVALWILRIFCVGGFLLFSVGIAWGTPIVARWVRDGLVASADVDEAHHGVDDSKAPAVRGRRVVHHPVLGDFHDQFAVVAPWAGAVTAGSELSVLVAPDKRETWLTLGLRADAQSGEPPPPAAARSPRGTRP
jgi:hypothetical protein